MARKSFLTDPRLPKNDLAMVCGRNCCWPWPCGSDFVLLKLLVAALRLLRLDTGDSESMSRSIEWLTQQYEDNADR